MQPQHNLNRNCFYLILFTLIIFNICNFWIFIWYIHNYNVHWSKNWHLLFSIEWYFLLFFKNYIKQKFNVKPWYHTRYILTRRYFQQIWITWQKCNTMHLLIASSRSSKSMSKELLLDFPSNWTLKPGASAWKNHSWVNSLTS